MQLEQEKEEELRRSEGSMNNSNIFSYLCLAFGLGVLCGILFAPRPGEETRKILIDQMEDSYEKACDFITDGAARAKKQVQEYMEDLKERVEEVK